MAAAPILRSAFQGLTVGEAGRVLAETGVRQAPLISQLPAECDLQRCRPPWDITARMSICEPTIPPTVSEHWPRLDTRHLCSRWASRTASVRLPLLNSGHSQSVQRPFSTRDHCWMVSTDQHLPAAQLDPLHHPSLCCTDRHFRQYVNIPAPGFPLSFAL